MAALGMSIPGRILTIMNKFANRVKRLLNSVIDGAKTKLEASKDKAARDRGSWFTFRRNALLPFEKVFKILAFSSGETIDQEMHGTDDFFTNSIKPTPSAFVQARDSIPEDSFESVFHDFTNQTVTFPYTGYIRVGCDGITIPFACMPTNNDPDYFIPGRSSRSHDNSTAEIESPQCDMETTPMGTPDASPAQVDSTSKQSLDNGGTNTSSPPRKLSRQQAKAQARAAKKTQKREKTDKKEREKKRRADKNNVKRFAGVDSAKSDEIDQQKADAVMSRPHCEAHLNVLHLANPGIILDGLIQPVHCKNERAAFLQMVEKLKVGPYALPPDVLNRIILSADRGYESFHMSLRLAELGMLYLIRSKGPQNKSSMLYSLKEFFPSAPGEFDIDIDVNLVRSMPKDGCTIDGKPCVKITATNCPECSKDHPAHLQIRVVCIRLNDDSYEYLITNLPRDAFPIGTMKAEYFMRWPVETSARFLKHVSGLLFLHAKKVSAVRKEIWAKLVMHNYCQAIIYEAVIQRSKKVDQNDNRHLYQINRSFATRIIRKFARKSRFTEDLIEVISARTEPVRPDRSFARRKRPKYVQSFLYRV